MRERRREVEKYREKERKRSSKVASRVERQKAKLASL